MPLRLRHEVQEVPWAIALIVASPCLEGKANTVVTRKASGRAFASIARLLPALGVTSATGSLRGIVTDVTGCYREANSMPQMSLMGRNQTNSAVVRLADTSLKRNLD